METPGTRPQVQVLDFDSETDKLDQHFASSSSRDGWKPASVSIPVPDGKLHASESDAPTYTIPGLWYRPLTQAIKAGIESAAERTFHYTPFKQYWQHDPHQPPERVHDEIYSSDAMAQAHTELQNQPPIEGCKLERVVVALMFWSDSTHLASFGDAFLWPLYLFFGNQSKTLRVKPTSNMCHHVAYFPKLPAAFNKFYENLTGKAPSAEMLTHCRRELMHSIWRLLLDDEFHDAYEAGIVCMCEDGIQRRFFPRLFTYSADYPEKVLLASLRSLGARPCPRCMLPKEQIPELGTVNDMKRRETLARVDDPPRRTRIATVRRWIYERAYGIKSKAVENYLQPQSETPTSNAFSDRLSKFSFNPFRMLVPDFMHEFELGVFKAFFIHLLRILQAHSPSSLIQLDTRFRLVPSFGRWTIRKFPESVSALKKLAAWNYESVLICAIPVVDGLLPEPYNSEVLDSLFTLAEWHALGKSRMHTDTSIAYLKTATKELGRVLRRFRDHVCPHFKTKELPIEEHARERRQTAAAKARKGKGRSKTTTTNASTVKKEYNMFTYKLHALGDYIANILWFGTSDSYSTQPGELEHRRVKRFYARTSKNRAIKQITVLERRERGLTDMFAPHRRAALAMSKMKPTPNRQRRGKPLNRETLPYTDPEQHHHIANAKHNPISLGSWLPEHRDDPATTNFLTKLLDHLLGRILSPEYTEHPTEFGPIERSKVVIRNDRIYEHKVFRVNYTTYDVRRAQDSLNSRYHSDIMSLAPENDSSHPFLYSQIIGVYHADVLHNVPEASTTPQRMEFLWVRRYRLERVWRRSDCFKKKRLYRVEFLPADDPNAFGFIDPDEVIRAAHLIPSFATGTVTGLLDADSVGRLERPGLKEDEDWRFYLINCFADRDMFMRYRACGVGHYRVDVPAETEDDLAASTVQTTSIAPPVGEDLVGPEVPLIISEVPNEPPEQADLREDTEDPDNDTDESEELDPNSDDEQAASGVEGVADSGGDGEVDRTEGFGEDLDEAGIGPPIEMQEGYAPL
ncbi:hypothetical protein GGX14DRAFT_363047 [Mycena pura]|uniref:Uncharacterized protein n=1 Tax=Mycena pura TaxID=153505 RepID=A0AAD6YFK9_9AGAR|nr:hypothetical protein GGX14DRAFT_363047 [Mycena pura]